MGSDPRTGTALQAIFAARLRAALDARDPAAGAEGRATALANRLARSVSTTARWLNGEMLPAVETLGEIAAAYNMSLDYLLGLSKDDRLLDEAAGPRPLESPRDPQPVLLVDDQKTAREILFEIARTADPQVQPVGFGGATEALRWAATNQADLVVTDYRLPGMDGLAFAAALRRLHHFADVPILMVTIVEDRELRRTALQQGINDFLQKPLDPAEGIARCRNLLAMSRQQALLRDRTHLLAGRVAARRDSGRDHAMLRFIAQRIEDRNGADGAHVARMVAVSTLLGRAVSLDDDALEDLAVAAALHDVGMLALPDATIAAARAGDSAAALRLEAHTVLGYRMLRSEAAGPLRAAALAALGHHERYDGRGYPTGLRGEDIPLIARIVAVADHLECLRAGAADGDWSPVWSALAGERGAALDPVLVDAVLAQREAVIGRHRQDDAMPAPSRAP
jgi:two-component system response regulator RpfG